MAIYHFRMKKSNSNGRVTLPTGHLKYIDREGKYKKEDILFKEVKNLPEEFEDIKDFWESVEKNERVNSNLYRELEIALPREFSNKENKKIVDEFCEYLFDNNYVYNYAIHSPSAHDGQNQPHVHIMFNERKIDNIKREKDDYFKRYNSKNIEKGGWIKDTKWREEDTLIHLRESWELLLNIELKKRDIEAVSSKSLEKQKLTAISEKDYAKAYELDREVINISGKLLYKKEKDLTEQERLQKKIFFQNRKIKENSKTMKDLLKKIEKLEANYKNANKEELELLDQIRIKQEKIAEINKKNTKENNEKTIYNMMTNKEFYNLLNNNKKIYKELKNNLTQEQKEKLLVRQEKNIKQLEKLKNDIQNNSKKSFSFKKRVENIEIKYNKKIAELNIEIEKLYTEVKEKNPNFNKLFDDVYNMNHIQYIYEKEGINKINKIEQNQKKLLEEFSEERLIFLIEEEIKNDISNGEYGKIIKNISSIEEEKKEINHIIKKKLFIINNKKYYENKSQNFNLKLQEEIAKRSYLETKFYKEYKAKINELLDEKSNIKLKKFLEKLSNKKEFLIEKENVKNKNIEYKNLSKEIKEIETDIKKLNKEILAGNNILTNSKLLKKIEEKYKNKKEIFNKIDEKEEKKFKKESIEKISKQSLGKEKIKDTLKKIDGIKIIEKNNKMKEIRNQKEINSKVSDKEKNIKSKKGIKSSSGVKKGGLYGDFRLKDKDILEDIEKEIE